MPEAVSYLEPWLSKRDLAAHLGCSVSWVEKRQAQGMPHTVIAGRCKYRASVVEPWLEARGHLEHRGEIAA
jgi:hypothetical protein